VEAIEEPVEAIEDPGETNEVGEEAAEAADDNAGEGAENNDAGPHMSNRKLAPSGGDVFPVTRRRDPGRKHRR
jgi:hypothetical protein